MYYLLVLIALLCGCSSGSGEKMRVGIDTTWYPIDFGMQNSYVNGFTEELLLEMSRYSGMDFELVQANWDTLREGLRMKNYDAILTSIPAYEYNTAQYDFSINYLNLGPVLIVPNESNMTHLSEMKGQLIGLIVNDPAVLVVEKYPELIVRNYPSIPEMLDGLIRGDIQAAMLNQIPAVNYVKDLYAGRLKIASDPMTDAGLHLITPKGKMGAFNKTLESLTKKKTVDSLQKKWQLSL